MNTSDKKYYLTEQGLIELKKEFEVLTKVKKHEVIKALQEARALGDLSENAEYHAAREEQGMIEAKIKEIEFIMDNVEIIPEHGIDAVSIGATVELEFVEDKDLESYTIVGSTEANPFDNKISNESPIALAILGHKKGDTVSVAIPTGSYEVKIVNIK